MMNTPFPEGSDLKIQFSTILLSVFFTTFFTGAFFCLGFPFFVISVWLGSATMVNSQKGGKRKFGTMNVGNNMLLISVVGFILKVVILILRLLFFQS